MFEIEPSGSGFLVVEAGVFNLGAAAPGLSFYDQQCQKMKAAKIGSSATSSVMFLPVAQGEKVFLAVSKGMLSAGDGGFWFQASLLSRGAGVARSWPDPLAEEPCETANDRRVSGPVSILTQPDLDDPIDEAVTEVMPSTGGSPGMKLSSIFDRDLDDPIDEAVTEVMPSIGGSGGVGGSEPARGRASANGDRWAMVFDRDLDDPIDEAVTEVMPFEVDEPVLLRVHSEATLGLVAIEEGNRCSLGQWPAESVLVDPSRELLAYLEPGSYRLRSFRPVGAGWSNPAVEVFPLGGE